MAALLERSRLRSAIAPAEKPGSRSAWWWWAQRQEVESVACSTHPSSHFDTLRLLFTDYKTCVSLTTAAFSFSMWVSVHGCVAWQVDCAGVPESTQRITGWWPGNVGTTKGSAWVPEGRSASTIAWIKGDSPGMPENVPVETDTNLHPVCSVPFKFGSSTPLAGRVTIVPRRYRIRRGPPLLPDVSRNGGSNDAVHGFGALQFAEAIPAGLDQAEIDLMKLLLQPRLPVRDDVDRRRPLRVGAGRRDHHEALAVGCTSYMYAGPGNSRTGKKARGVSISKRLAEARMPAAHSRWVVELKKNNSLPSPRQRGWVNSLFETCHFAPVDGNA